MTNEPADDCVIDICERFFSQNNLRTFHFNLPLTGDSAKDNAKGIKEKFVKNKSGAKTPFNTGDDRDNTLVDVSDEIKKWDTFVCRMVEKSGEEPVKGFVVICAAFDESTDSGEYVPLGGGVVEEKNDNEAVVQAIWTRRKIDEDEHRQFAAAITAFVLATAFKSLRDNLAMMKRRSTNDRFVTVKSNRIIMFPTDANQFLTDVVELAKHKETPNDAGEHSDNPKSQCRCLKKFQDAEDAEEFLSIAFPRFQRDVNKWAGRIDTRPLRYFSGMDLGKPKREAAVADVGKQKREAAEDKSPAGRTLKKQRISPFAE